MIRPSATGEKQLVNEFAVSFIVYLCVMGGALVGIYLHPVLPPDHMKDDTRQIVNVAIGLIATLSALVLGLMVASAKSSFDARSEEVRGSGARIIMLDRTLRQYGPETRDTRELLRQLTEGRIKRVWGEPGDPAQEGVVGSQAAGIEAVRSQLFALTPGNEAKKWLHARALTLLVELEQARWLLIEQSRSSIPTPFLVVLVSWLAIIFASLGLFAPRNGTVYTIIFVCALSVATAIFLILEMDQPFEGLLQIPDAPLRSALAEMSR
jgi:Protein of unknown function (DUF4239)